VDAFIGTSQINDILAVCDPKTNNPFIACVPTRHSNGNVLIRRIDTANLATPYTLRFVKIARRLPTDHRAAFCFIPQMRGHFRSRRFGSIVAEAPSTC
jgi:ribosomal protein S12 methylthiotransferase